MRRLGQHSRSFRLPTVWALKQFITWLADASSGRDVGDYIVSVLRPRDGVRRIRGSPRDFGISTN